MSFVKSLNLEQKLSSLVDVPIPFIPSRAFNQFQFDSQWRLGRVSVPLTIL